MLFINPILLCFEYFRHTLPFCHFLNQSMEHMLRLLVNIGKIAVKCTLYGFMLRSRCKKALIYAILQMQK